MGPFQAGATGGLVSAIVYTSYKSYFEPTRTHTRSVHCNREWKLSPESVIISRMTHGRENICINCNSVVAKTLI